MKTIVITLELALIVKLHSQVSGEIGEDPNGVPNNLMPFLTQVAVGKYIEENNYY